MMPVYRWTVLVLGVWLMAASPSLAGVPEPEPFRRRRVAEATQNRCAILLAARQGQPSDPLIWVERARQTGEFAQAEKELGKRLEGPDGIVNDPHEIALEILRRIRLDYSLTPAAALARIQRDIPDATAEDLERWREQGVLQHRVIDGQFWYFEREPANLYRFCPKAKSRRDTHRKTSTTREEAPSFVLTDHLADLVKLGERSGDPEVHPVKHTIAYRVTIKKGHPLVRPGAAVRCWLPFPQAYRQQKDVRLIDAGPAEPVIAPNGHPQRTLYFERRIENPAGPIEFRATFEFVTYGYYPQLDPARVKPYQTSSLLHRTHTAERPPHIVFTRELRETVRSIVGDETNPLLKGRKIFRWVCENIRYCSEMEYSTIRSLSGKALATRKGDCGVQGMLFVTMCRCAGIPARWQSGWETKPSGWNMHDWAEFYIEPWGWLPADPSYGLQDHPDPNVHEFYYGHLDAYRMIVNLDYARPLTPPKTSFRSEPNDFQRGEVEIDGKNLYFDEWDWTFEVRTVLLEPTAAKSSNAQPPG